MSEELKTAGEEQVVPSSETRREAHADQERPLTPLDGEPSAEPTPSREAGSESAPQEAVTDVTAEMHADEPGTPHEPREAVTPPDSPSAEAADVVEALPDTPNGGGLSSPIPEAIAEKMAGEHLGEATVPDAAVMEEQPAAPASGTETPEPDQAFETEPSAGIPGDAVDADDFVVVMESVDSERVRLKAIIEAVIYITDEPLTLSQIAMALTRPADQIKPILDELASDYGQPDRGLSIREVAGGYKMATKPEHHEEIRTFVKNLKPPLKLSLAALETLAVIAYKQPITAPEIMEIRGVQGAGVLKTLLDRKLIATAGRKNVIGKPILYKTTKEFLVQFGLKDLGELPTLKEFEELGRLALTDAETEPAVPEPLTTMHEPGHTPATLAFDPEAPLVEVGAVEPEEETPRESPATPEAAEATVEPAPEPEVPTTAVEPDAEAADPESPAEAKATNG